MIPESDRRRIQQFCASQWPERFHEEVFWEAHVRGKSVTICETRAPWAGEGEWSHQPFAQLRFRPDTGDWQLHWADRNSRWHLYDFDDRNPFGTCAELLAEIDADPSCIFKG